MYHSQQARPHTDPTMAHDLDDLDSDASSLFQSHVLATDIIEEPSSSLFDPASTTESQSLFEREISPYSWTPLSPAAVSSINFRSTSSLEDESLHGEESLVSQPFDIPLENPLFREASVGEHRELDSGQTGAERHARHSHDRRPENFRERGHGGLDENDFKQLVDLDSSDQSSNEDSNDADEDSVEQEDTHCDPEEDKKDRNAFNRRGRRLRKKTKYEGAKHRCDKCSVGFSRKSNLSIHVRAKHSKHPPQRIRCLECVNMGKTNGHGGAIEFGRPTDLKRHILTIHCKSRILCPHCDRAMVPRVDTVERHFLTHKIVDASEAKASANKLVKRENKRIAKHVDRVVEESATYEDQLRAKRASIEKSRRDGRPSLIARLPILVPRLPMQEQPPTLATSGNPGLAATPPLTRSQAHAMRLAGSATSGATNTR